MSLERTPETLELSLKKQSEINFGTHFVMFVKNLLVWQFLLFLISIFFNKRPGPIKSPVRTSTHPKASGF